MEREGTMARNKLVVALTVVVMALMMAAAPPAAGQLGLPLPGGTAMSCTASLVTSFAPCVNFVTNSTASPTADCCRSLRALVNASAGCACLVLTGSVPLGVPVNRSLAVTMPRACNTSAVPLLCQDATTSAQTPAPGPAVAEVAPPSLPPLPAAATPVSEAAPAPATIAPVEPKTATTTTPPVSQAQTRPAVLPSSGGGAWRKKKSARVSATAAFVLLLASA